MKGLWVGNDGTFYHDVVQDLLKHLEGIGRVSEWFQKSWSISSREPVATGFALLCVMVGADGFDDLLSISLHGFVGQLQSSFRGFHALGFCQFGSKRYGF